MVPTHYVNIGTPQSTEGDPRHLGFSYYPDPHDPQTTADPTEGAVPETPPPPKSRRAATRRVSKCSNCGQIGHTSELSVAHLSS